MTSRDFVIWLKGFTEACSDFTATPKQWDRIKEVLGEVEDYNDNPGLDEEVDDWYGTTHQDTITVPNFLSGKSSSINFITTSGSGATSVRATVWNDQMGCWHYTNYPEGFGYFTNSTIEKTVPEETKKQLLD